jgi:hypothetical protein
MGTRGGSRGARHITWCGRVMALGRPVLGVTRPPVCELFTDAPGKGQSTAGSVRPIPAQRPSFARLADTLLSYRRDAVGRPRNP